ncbi:hypothetical protein LCGC14_0350100 [marine sediment metagenome]|uniref:Uncharacterized protein n=1 Tax=marine sediment metagenome TaxID=412755 RepID=A0A0F9WJ62_9ZZZZ
MAEPKIERYEVIIPDTVANDGYGNIVVQRQGGQEVRVNKKHEPLHGLFREAAETNRALKLGFAVYLDKEYVHTAEFFDGEPPGERQVEHITAREKPLPAPQELGMWWKELGNRIGDGSIERDYPTEAVKIKTQYYRQMAKVTGVKFTME